MGDFERGLVKLGVRGQTLGLAVKLSEPQASCSPTVLVFSLSPELLVLTYTLERRPDAISIPTEYVLEIPCFRPFKSRS